MDAPPLDFKGWPRDRARRRMRFFREYLTIPRGKGAGKPFVLQPFQQDIIKGAFAPGIRTALVSIPRANGKTMWASGLAIAEMLVGPPSAEVLVIASDQRQANITLRYAKRMVELNPVLSERIQVYSDRLYLPENDATLLPLPAEPGAVHGFDPSLLIVDELHVVTEAVWEAVTSVSGKRPESLTLAISTPATSSDSIMWKLVEHGRGGTDPSFYITEFAAPDGCAINDRDAWRIANPALTCPKPFLAEDGLASAIKTLREPVARQLRLGQWVTGVDAWLPWGAWDACATSRIVQPGERACLAFDGSASGDSTALVGCTLDGHIWLEGIWENPGDPRWRVPREEVSNAVDLAFQKYSVAGMAVDPWGWESELESWANRHGEKVVIEWNTAAAQRMAPATDRWTRGRCDPTGFARRGPTPGCPRRPLCRETNPSGDLVSKDKKNSPRRSTRPLQPSPAMTWLPFMPARSSTAPNYISH